MTRRNYPAKGAHRLAERDGQLYFESQHICPVPEFRQGWSYARVGYSEAYNRLRAAIGDHWHFYAIYRCKHCGHWAVGSGFSWCSEECRRRSRAQYVRNVRAERAPAWTPICAECGASIAAQRRTRKFCSDRCRQAAHRKASQMA